MVVVICETLTDRARIARITILDLTILTHKVQNCHQVLFKCLTCTSVL